MAELNQPVDFGLTFQFGSPFDPTRSATDQAAADPARSITRSSIPFSLGPSAMNFNGNTGVHFLAETDPVTAFDSNSGQTRTFLPRPPMFGADSQIGPGSNQLSVVTVELLYTFEFPGQTAIPLLQGVGGLLPTTGFRLDLADGPHYGYVSWQSMQIPQGPPFVQYYPRRWGCETQPNTPITLVPSTGASVLVLAAGFSLARRRRV